MEQMVFDRLAVFDYLIAHAARRPESRADSERRSDGGDLLHLRVMMFVMMPGVDMRSMRAVMMCTGQRFCRAAGQHKTYREDERQHSSFNHKCFLRSKRPLRLIQAK